MGFRPVPRADGDRLDLDESSLDELVGVCGAGFPINWDDNPDVTSGVQRNVNCEAGDSAPCCTNPGTCYDEDCDMLEDSNDWSHLQLPIPGSHRAPREIVECHNVPPEW